jgi:hypothetical protein
MILDKFSLKKLDKISNLDSWKYQIKLR